MRQIQLTKNKVTLVDDKDFEYVNHFKWYCSFKGYAVRSKKINGKKITIHLHRELLNCPQGFEVDHINGDRLDNRRENLRVCLSSQNHINRCTNKKSSSGYRGINKSGNYWISQIQINKINHYFGTFKTIKEALIAYQNGIRLINNQFINGERL